MPQVAFAGPSPRCSSNWRGSFQCGRLHAPLSVEPSNQERFQGKRLQTIQQTLSGVDYIIVDEMSMVGRKIFGQVDRRLRQVFPARSEELFGRCSFLLFGDWGQLPPVMDLPLYTTVSRTELPDLGSANYHLFDRAVALDRVMRQAGQDADQELFRNLLLWLRNGESSVGDWKQLMKRTPAEVGNVSSFDAALASIPHWKPLQSTMPSSSVPMVSLWP